MTPSVGIIMGSQSDWPTMGETATLLDELGISYEAKIVSAHRTPDRLWSYGKEAAGILALQDADLATRLDAWRDTLSTSIPEDPSDD